MSEVDNTAEVKAPVAKIDAAAEKAYAEASAKIAEAPKAAPVVKTPAAPKKAPVTAKKAAPVKKAAAKTVNKKTATKTAPVKKPAPVKKVAVKTAKPAPAPKTSAPKITTPSISTITKLKDTIMATANTADITATAKNVVADLQSRAQTAYAKGTELTADATEFTKANVEAVVESGKIFFAGAQELLKDNVETGKTVIETVTEDAKKVAAVKSPTELFQLQGEIARRNFDAVVAYGSKRTEAWVKLYNDAFAPISNRVSVAVEKVKTAA
ncbi:MAG: hypothetical protein C0486_00615 [Erythrobacter sp.]|nr:hypothetical protein [Erythrobacter sp.]MBA4082312.1 hypothetical protein [Erythrobacter sp.]